MGVLTKYEQETIINFSAGGTDAIVYTRDKAVIRKIDSLVTEFPEVFRCIKETDIDKTYVMPKQCVSYRKPRRISADRRKQIKQQMKAINSAKRNGGL